MPGGQGPIVIVIAIVDSAIALLPIVYSVCTLCIQCFLDNGLCFASHFCTTAHDLCLVLPNYGRTVCVWVSQIPWQLRSWAAPQHHAAVATTDAASANAARSRARPMSSGFEPPAASASAGGATLAFFLRGLKKSFIF